MYIVIAFYVDTDKTTAPLSPKLPGSPVIVFIYFVKNLRKSILNTVSLTSISKWNSNFAPQQNVIEPDG